MKIYQSKIRKLSGSDYREVYSQARVIYKKISSKTKRKPLKEDKRSGEKHFTSVFPEH